MDHRCINCQYLATKVQRQGLPEVVTVTRAERSTMKNNNCQLEGVKHFHCHMKVWDERMDMGVKNRSHNVVEKDREGQCFFYPHKPNMSLEDAVHRQKNNPQPSGKPTLLGERAWLIWIVSFIALSASIIYVATRTS